MRDLSQQTFVKRKGSLVPVSLRIFFLVAVVLIVLFLVKAKFNAGGISGGRPIVLTDAPRGLTPVKFNQTPITDGGLNLSSDTATFKDVKYGGQAKATATRTYGDGSFALSVAATLPDPKGNRYQVWFVDSQGNVASAGFMEGSKASWSLVFRDKDKYSKYNRIWITKEITSEDNEPEEHVLEGSF